MRSALLLSTLMLFAGSGCTSDTATTQPTSADRALRDPMGYSPQIDRNSINGGAINNYDKNAMKRDMDSVFNP